MKGAVQIYELGLKKMWEIDTEKKISNLVVDLFSTLLTGH